LLEHKAQAGEHPAIWHGTMPPDLLQATPPRPTGETPIQGTQDKQENGLIGASPQAEVNRAAPGPQGAPLGG